jgi:hypothetical protein
MLGTNQRPLPREYRSMTSWLFAVVQITCKTTNVFLSTRRGCSPLFAWVGVLLVYCKLHTGAGSPTALNLVAKAYSP